jgi:hypothetical protein
MTDPINPIEDPIDAEQDEDDSEIVEAFESVGDVPAEEPPPDEGDGGDEQA